MGAFGFRRHQFQNRDPHIQAYRGEGFLTLLPRILGVSWPQVRSPVVKSLFLISSVWLVSPDTRDSHALDCPHWGGS